jgi:hypothetical protein
MYMVYICCVIPVDYDVKINTKLERPTHALNEEDALHHRP